MPSVAIAGATGYLGSHLARAFVAEGFAVAVLKRTRSSLARLEPILDQLSLHDVDGDRGEEAIVRLRPDLLVHAATCYAVSYTHLTLPTTERV